VPPVSERARDVTVLLQEWQRGDVGAVERLLPLVYNELRRVARARLRREPEGHTLQAAALVHEAYLRLVGPSHPTPRNRAHLFAISARLMREILVDHARRTKARKRGGRGTTITLAESTPAPGIEVVDLLALDRALDELALLEPRLCQVVELKFFAGLNIGDTAEALKVSSATVARDWAIAKAWLSPKLTSRSSA
jgi:RNA polymerase sigma factor (TIGR02999 family)